MMTFDASFECGFCYETSGRRNLASEYWNSRSTIYTIYPPSCLDRGTSSLGFRRPRRNTLLDDMAIEGIIISGMHAHASGEDVYAMDRIGEDYYGVGLLEIERTVMYVTIGIKLYKFLHPEVKRKVCMCHSTFRSIH